MCEPEGFQLVQQRPQTGKDALPLRSHEDPEGSDDIQLESMGQPAGTQIVEDDLQPKLPRQDDGLGLACIDRSREKDHPIRVGQIHDLQPGQGKPKFSGDLARSIDWLEQCRQQVQLPEPFQGDQAGTVGYDGLIQSSSSRRNSSGE